MPSTLTPNEVVERGEAIYAERLRSELEPAHLGAYVVIDVDTGAYQVGPEYYPLTKAMLAENLNAVLCILKIGFPAAVSINQTADWLKIMLMTEKTYTKDCVRPGLSHYGALLEWIGDSELQWALLTMNVNMLRRSAPYAYLFAGEHISGEKALDAPATGFLTNVERKELQRGVWFTYPDCNDPIITTVFAINAGDISSVTYYLNQEEFSLLCLPHPVSLDWIDETIAQSPNNLEALQALLTQGGFLVSIVDGQIFAVQTYEHHYAQYFAKSL